MYNILKQLRIYCSQHLQNLEMDDLGKSTYGRISKIYLSHNRSFMHSLVPYLKEKKL